jgi:hypothetical protein
MFGLGSKYLKFWKWFRSRETEIFHFENDQEKVFDKLAAELRRVHPDLVFEFSSIVDGRREFTISAGGIRAAFAEVTTLVREAPTLQKWKILAFRQRQDIPSIKCGDKELQRDAIFFDHATVGDKADLTLFMPGIRGASPQDVVGLKTIGYLMLDSVVGEYDVETRIAGIEFVDAADQPERRRIPLRELAAIVDALPRAVQ